MAKFLNRLSVIELNSVANDGRGNWKLLTDLSFKSDILKAHWITQGKNETEAELLSVITAKAGFETDFMSIPPKMPEFTRLSRSRRAGAIHDMLYSKDENGLHAVSSRELADNILKEMFIADVTEDGGATTDVKSVVLEIEAELIYQGARIGGAGHWL